MTRCLAVGDRAREQLRHAAIAPVVHVQRVRRDESLERNMLDFVPVAHQREPIEQIDALLLGGKRNLIFHARISGLASTRGANCISISMTSAPAAA